MICYHFANNIRGSGTYCSTLIRTITDLHPLGSVGLVKFQDIRVDLDLLFSCSNGDSSNICHSLSSDIFAVADANSLFLITPFEVLSLSCEYGQHFVE